MTIASLLAGLALAVWIYLLVGRGMFWLARERDELRIVADQTGVPNWSRELAAATAKLIGQGRSYLADRAGLYHLSSTGSTTWHGFAQAIVGSAGKPRVTPIMTADYPTPARRPAYAVLGTARFERTFGFGLPAWQESLAACLREERRQDRPTEP